MMSCWSLTAAGLAPRSCVAQPHRVLSLALYQPFLLHLPHPLPATCILLVLVGLWPLSLLNNLSVVLSAT